MNWPPESYEAERKFNSTHARLFPFLGKRVRTPRGEGILFTAFSSRAEVVMPAMEVPDGSQKVKVFHPDEITPV
jgi:hypothetical protein